MNSDRQTEIDKVDNVDFWTLHQSKGNGYLEMFGVIQCPLIDIFSYSATISVLAFCKGKDFDVFE